MEDKSICPVCGQLECYTESEGEISSYLCMGCGYTSNSKFKMDYDVKFGRLVESIELRRYEMTTPELIKASRFVDSTTALAWYPSVLNFSSKGIIFPDGTNEMDWSWRVAKVVPVPEADKLKYPIPNKEGEYYTTRLDMKNSKVFNRMDFSDACVELGILERKQ